MPNLSVPPEGCVIILETDGCMEGWGGVCKWKKALKDPHSTEQICAYASGKFNPIKSTIDAEIYACINSLEAFKIYYLDKEWPTEEDRDSMEVLAGLNQIDELILLCKEKSESDFSKIICAILWPG